MNATTDPIVSALEGLERTPAQHPAREKENSIALPDGCPAGMRRGVRQRAAALKSDEGKLVDVESPLLPSPAMDRLTDRLREELGEILDEVASLRSEIRRQGGAAPRIGAVRARLAHLLATLQHY